MGGSFKIKSWMGRNNKCTRWLLYLVNLFIYACQKISAGVHREHQNEEGRRLRWLLNVVVVGVNVSQTAIDCDFHTQISRVWKREHNEWAAAASLSKCFCWRFCSRRATRRTGYQSGQLGTENSSYQLTLTHQNWTTEDLEMNWRKAVWMAGPELVAFILACANSSGSWCQCRGFYEILLTQFGPLWYHYGPCLPVATSSRSQTLKPVSWARQWPHSPPVTFTVTWSQSKWGPTQF